jgi:hypothetical protein
MQKSPLQAGKILIYCTDFRRQFSRSRSSNAIAVNTHKKEMGNL